MAQSIQAFVTELTRVIRNTDLDDPVKFAAFRQVAEERIQSYCDQENGLLEIEHRNKATLLVSCEKALEERDKELLRLRPLAEKVKDLMDHLTAIRKWSRKPYFLKATLRDDPKVIAVSEALSDYLKENK